MIIVENEGVTGWAMVGPGRAVRSVVFWWVTLGGAGDLSGAAGASLCSA